MKDSAAQIRCAMFRSRTALLKFQPKVGDLVEVRGKVSLYENRGDYQLIVDQMKPAGEGALLLAFQQLKQSLEREGLFSQENKKALPRIINRVAIITSPTGAAIHDMLTVLNRRWPLIEVDLYPTMVQGHGSAEQMIQALENANRDNLADVIILGRGGGSLEDLWSFNDERLARAIAMSSIPTISAVGHEVDFSISDFVADVRAPTPSAAAEMISPDKQQLLNQLASLKQRLLASQQYFLTVRNNHLHQLSSRLRSPQNTLQQQFQRLDQLEIRLQKHQKNQLAQLALRLDSVLKRIHLHHPSRKLEQHQKQLDNQFQKLKQLTLNSLKDRRNALCSSTALLSSLSPLNVLARGYSLTTDENNQVLFKAEDVSIGQKIRTRLSDGEIVSTVSEMHKPS